MIAEDCRRLRLTGIMMAFRRRAQSSHDRTPPAPDQPLAGIDVPLTVREVATVLRTSAKGVYAMIARRQLPGVLRLNRRVLIEKRALVEWLRRKSTPHREGER